MEPHATRIVVWDTPPAVECGAAFKLQSRRQMRSRMRGRGSARRDSRRARPQPGERRRRRRALGTAPRRCTTRSSSCARPPRRVCTRGKPAPPRSSTWPAAAPRTRPRAHAFHVRAVRRTGVSAESRRRRRSEPRSDPGREGRRSPVPRADRCGRHRGAASSERRVPIVRLRPRALSVPQRRRDQTPTSRSTPSSTRTSDRATPSFGPDRPSVRAAALRRSAGHCVRRARADRERNGLDPRRGVHGGAGAPRPSRVHGSVRPMPRLQARRRVRRPGHAAGAARRRFEVPAQVERPHARRAVRVRAHHDAGKQSRLPERRRCRGHRRRTCSQSSGMPAGADALQPDVAALASIVILSQSP